jgi:hypothetical protein
VVGISQRYDTRSVFPCKFNGPVHAKPGIQVAGTTVPVPSLKIIFRQDEGRLAGWQDNSLLDEFDEERKTV